MARVVQLTDSHVVRAGQTYFSVDTAAYLAEAIQGVNALRPLPEYVVVTGDLVNTGNAAEYKHFVSIMTALRVPYFATAGNHDERAAFRAGLPPAAYGGASGARVDFVVDDYPVRLIALEANTVRPWVGAVIDREQLDWLETTLATGRERPTLLAVHQPPFRTGLHYFDIFGYRGKRRLRRIISRSPQVGRVISGHIHCVKTYLWKNGTLVATAPSTAPQIVPEFFEHRILGVRSEVPGFTVHDWNEADGFSSTVYRRNETGTFTFGAPLPLATRR
jgi:Icc protein